MANPYQTSSATPPPASWSTVDHALLAELIADSLACLRPTLVVGSPGAGKSAACYAGAQRHATSRDLTLTRYPYVESPGPRTYGWIDCRLPGWGPEDVRGIPSASPHGTTAWLGPDLWPSVRAVEEGRHPAQGCLILEEITAAAMAVQVGAYQMVHDRVMSDQPLAPGWGILATGNRTSDRAGAQRLSTALANRFRHLTLDPAWSETLRRDALSQGWMAPVVAAFLTLRPALCYQAPGNADDLAFPTFRTWSAVGRISPTLSPRARRAAIVGEVGQTAGEQYVAFEDLLTCLPDPRKIIADPRGHETYSDPALCYALALALANMAAPGPAWTAIMTYMYRLGGEFAALTMVTATERDSRLKDTPEYQRWVKDNPLA